MSSNILIEYAVWNDAGFKYIVRESGDVPEATEILYKEVGQKEQLMLTLDEHDLELLIKVLQRRVEDIKELDGKKLSTHD